jgi:phenylalanine-4-hydroxylase
MQAAIVELDADHPGFNDPEYRRRRDEIASVALAYRAGDPLPRIEFTDTENGTWGTLFRELRRLFPTHACEEFRRGIEELDLSENEIPQLADLDAALSAKTGFRIRPVAGLVDPRDFFEALSRRIFLSTQYIRHHSVPHYTPEPDTVHDLIGHIPMLTSEEYADLTQKLGEGARGATDEQVEEIARLYWFTIEFGVVRQQGGLRCYGAGLLSSFGEMERAVRAEEPEIRRFDPDEACQTEYPITRYQPLLWEVASIQEAFDRVCDGIERIKSGRVRR